MNCQMNETFLDEADLLKRTEDYLSRIREVKWFRVCDRYNKGYSDILACVRGWFVAAELKAVDGEPSVHQAEFIQDILNAGGIAGVCYTLGDVDKLVQEAIQRGGYQ